jgi:hypothetical protein
MHNAWLFEVSKSEHSGCPENWRIEKNKLNRPVSYSMQMRKICLMALFGRNRGCITTNTNHSALQSNGNIPVHFQSYAIRWEGYAYHILRFSGSTAGPFSEDGKKVNSVFYCEDPLRFWDAICWKCPGQLARGLLLHHESLSCPEGNSKSTWPLVTSICLDW